MIRLFALALVVSVLLVGGAGTASAALLATLAFTDPGNAIVGPNDAIPVYLRLTLDPLSDRLTTSVTTAVSSPVVDFATVSLFGGLPFIPDLANDTLDAYINEGFQCSGTFTASCITGPPYDFTFNYPGSLIAPAGFDLGPGESYTWLFGTFTPTGGSALAGTYDFLSASLAFFVRDLSHLVSPDPNNPGGYIDDPDGFPLTIGSISLADTTNGPFERTVVSGVPEPGTWMLMLTGLVLTGGTIRRRKNVTAA